MSDEEDQSDEILALNEICGDSIKPFKVDDNPDLDDFEEPAQQFFKTRIGRSSKFRRGGSLYSSPDFQGGPVTVHADGLEFVVNHLLPLRLDFLLPPDYPSGSCPIFALSAEWLSEVQLEGLKRKLVEIYQENSGSVILFMWQSFLRDESLEFLETFDGSGRLDISPVISQNSMKSGTVTMFHQKFGFGVVKEAKSGRDFTFTKRNLKVNVSEGDEVEFLEEPKASGKEHKAIKVCGVSGRSGNFSTKLMRMMKDFNVDMEEKEFQGKMFDCDICFAQKSGAKCLRFPGCDHVYCESCMGSYFAVQIKQGLMSNLICPQDSCSSQALPTQVKKLVPEELYDMYEGQMLATTLEAMTDVQLCPKIECQCPTLIDRDRNMGQCPKCEFAFCIYCNMAFHGLAGCSINSKEKLALINNYMNGSKMEQERLEKRYGKKTLVEFRDKYLSDKYIEEKAKKCPNCQTPIEKSEGCNKMTCFKCNTYFCYLCGAKLQRANPYAHYNSLQSECNGQLFEGEDFEEFELWVDDGDSGDDELLEDWLAQFQD